MLHHTAHMYMYIYRLSVCICIYTDCVSGHWILLGSLCCTTLQLTAILCSILHYTAAQECHRITSCSLHTATQEHHQIISGSRRCMLQSRRQRYKFSKVISPQNLLEEMTVDLISRNFIKMARGCGALDTKILKSHLTTRFAT